MNQVTIEMNFSTKNLDNLISQQQRQSNNDALQLDDIFLVVQDIIIIKQIKFKLPKIIVKQHKQLLQSYNKLTKSVKVNYEINLQDIAQPYYPLPEAFIEYLKNPNQIEKIINKSTYLYYQSLFVCGLIFSDERAQFMALDHIKECDNLFEQLLQLLSSAYQYKSDIISFKIYELIKQILFWKFKIADIKLPLSNTSITNLKKTIFELLTEAEVKINHNIYQIYLLKEIAYKSQELIYSKYYSTIPKRTKFYLYCKIKQGTDELQNNYPQNFVMKYKENGDVAIIGYQETSSSEILLFSKECVNFAKYNEFYLGCIQHNIWRTEFILYDNGIDEKYSDKLPNPMGRLKKQIMHLKFDTCITKSQPWYFQVNLNDSHTLVVKKPDFNELVQAHIVHFLNPEIKKISAQNFQLVENGKDQVYYEHGRMDDDRFHIDSLDYLNLLEVISISLITLCKKPFVR